MASSETTPGFVPKLKSADEHKECKIQEERHMYGKGNSHVCFTEGKGIKRGPHDLVLDSSEGFIPLWGKEVILRWEFDEASLAFYQDSDGIKNYVRQLMNEALNLWGASVPVRFSENPNVWDFQVSIAPSNNCDPTGACTLARAFFPDPGRNSLLLFPRMFDQVYKEQLDTIVHEMGHIFGLRHFFAPKLETRWPSEIFGNHEAFSIMNYGDMSELTERDLSDLANLYEAAWSGELETINGTPIRFIRPYHEQA